jgi:hypothetical protein
VTSSLFLRLAKVAPLIARATCKTHSYDVQRTMF